MSQHHLDTYQDRNEEWRWRITVDPGTPGGTDPDIIGVSSEGYKNKADMMKSFFGQFFGEWDDSFLAEYNQWDPAGNQIGA